MRCGGISTPPVNLTPEEIEQVKALFAVPPKKVFDQTCPECGAMLVVKDSKYGLFFGCETWSKTGCRGSARANPDGSPAGFPVDGATKDARRAAHEVFDQLWKGGRMSRTQAYVWLAQELGLPREKTHLGLFSKEECERVAALVSAHLTEDEELQMAERDLMGDSALVLGEVDRRDIEALPRDRDKLARKISGGYLPVPRICALLRIAIAGEANTTARNILDALREYDRKRGREPKRF